MAKSMYDIIKKQNGEAFAKAIRNYDNGIFDIPNIDKIVKYAGREAEPIMGFLISLKQVRIEEMSVHRDPIELLAEAGYDAYVADTLEKQNAIKKYFVKGEELCTFRDPHRFKKYYIINAVRKDVGEIKRGTPPKREDAYGTSVISIQVLKTGGFISIKNRYNHTVDNPDNTLNSNPDNIILGLSDAIRHYFNVDFATHKVDVPNGYVWINGQLCKYNQEIFNVYFAEDFYIKNGEIYEIDKNKELMLGDSFILDLQKREVYSIFESNKSKFFEIVGVRGADGDFIRFTDFKQMIEPLIQGKALRVQKNKDGSKSIFADNTEVLSVTNGMLSFILMNSDVKQLCLTYRTLRGDLDFSHVHRWLNLRGCDFSDVTSIILPVCEDYMPNLYGTTGWHGDLNFSYLNLFEVEDADFSKVTSIAFPENVFMENTCFKCNLDFRPVESLVLRKMDLSSVPNIKFNPKASEIDLAGTKGLRGDLDFSHVKRLDLTGADLSQVTSIKFNPFGVVYGLLFKDKRKFLKDRLRTRFIDGVTRVKQKFSQQNKSKVKKNEEHAM